MKKVILSALILFAGMQLRAQVGIGNVVPDSSAILDLRNTNNRALLLPSIPGTPPSSPAGLVYWDNTLDKILYLESTGYNALSPWRYKFGGAISENTYFNTSGNVGIGNDSPQSKLHVTSNGGLLTLEGTSSTFIRFYRTGYTSGQTGAIGYTSANNTLHITNNMSGVDVQVNVSNGGDFNVQGGRIQQNGNDLLPAGAIIMWSGTSIPAGWALCNGSTFLSEDGITYTTPNLSGRFIVGYQSGSSDYGQPGNRSEAGSTNGGTGGLEEVTLSSSQMPSHTHAKGTLSTASAGSHSHNITMAAGSTYSTGGRVRSDGDFDNEGTYYTQNAGEHTHTINGSTAATGGNSSGVTQAHENRPPYYVLAFIMKK